MTTKKVQLDEIENACRYSENVYSLLKKLHAVEVLDFTCNNDYQGDMDLSVLLEDGRVFSYAYSYGSCSGCDDWEARSLTDKQIEDEIARDATYFSDVSSFNAFNGKRLTLKESIKNNIEL